MYLKIDTEVERFELVFKGFERPFTFQIIWKRVPNLDGWIDGWMDR